MPLRTILQHGNYAFKPRRLSCCILLRYVLWWNIITEWLSHHLCHILLAKSESQILPTLKGNGLYKNLMHRGHLRLCPAQRTKFQGAQLTNWVYITNWCNMDILISLGGLSIANKSKNKISLSHYFGNTAFRVKCWYSERVFLHWALCRMWKHRFLRLLIYLLPCM